MPEPPPYYRGELAPSTAVMPRNRPARVLRLKPAAPADLEQLLALDRLCLGGLWNRQGYARELASPNSTLLLLAERDCRARVPLERALGLGCLWSILEEAHITVLGVRPECRRQGLGRLLLGALLQAAITRQLERASLEVRASNDAAIGLYRQFGFVALGQRRNYYTDPIEDATVLWLRGLDEPALAAWLQRQQAALQRCLARAGWAFCDERDRAAVPAWDGP